MYLYKADGNVEKTYVILNKQPDPEIEMTKLLVLLALVAAASAKSIDFLSPTGRIVGGQAVSINQIPYQVSLRVLHSHYCGGSIISENWILSSALCMVFPPSWYTARVGSSLSNSDGTLVQVSSIISHPSFDRNPWRIPVNDIALVRTDAITFNAAAQPIGLFDFMEESVVGTQAFISGWGAHSEIGFNEIELHAAMVPIISKSDCNVLYAHWNGLPQGQICAGAIEGGSDTCDGDYGGPLAINGRLAGISSWGQGCGRAERPGVYTEIAAYRTWITLNSGI